MIENYRESIEHRATTTASAHNFLSIINKNFSSTEENIINETFIKPKDISPKNVFKVKNQFKELNENDHNEILFHPKKNKNKSTTQQENSNDEIISLEDPPKTLLEFINNTDTGIPMSTEIKKKKPKKKKEESNEAESFSNELSNISAEGSHSQKDSHKHFLRNKTTRQEPIPEKNNLLENDKIGSPNYTKFFKHKLIFDPVTNSMIIQKPTIAEASLKMHAEILRQNTPMVNENGEKLKITSASFKKNLHTDKWSEVETTFFYKALECFGTDFSFLEIVLKPRNRAQIKNKFRKEEKENPAKIEASLKKYDPKKLIKIIAVVKQFKEEAKTKNKKKYKHNGKKDLEVQQEFDFKKLFNEIELDNIKEELNFEAFINQESEGRLDEDSSENSEDESEKTVTINQEEKQNEFKDEEGEGEGEGNTHAPALENRQILEKNDEYFYLKNLTSQGSKKPTQNFNTNFQNNNLANSAKTSKVKIIINEVEEIGQKVSGQPQERESKQDSQVFCMDFLKKFQ